MEDYIICKVCGEKVKRLYGAHLKKHNMISKEYEKKYPGEPLTSTNDNKNTSKNSGLHMKTDKYKKMFSEKFNGVNNPNHKSKTTKQKRKERSQFSIEFHKDKDKLEKFRKLAWKNKRHTTRLNYYNGYSLEESKKLLKERQTTFTLDICIDKYGKIKGKEIYTKRQEKWQKTLNENGNLKLGYSKISQELFYSILNKYKINDRENVYFATKNNEIKLQKRKGGIWLYDFVDKKRKKIIEYNGDRYHANPKTYESNDNPHPYKKETSAQEIWDKDKEKLLVANKKGFDVLVIWDSDYKKNK